MNNYITGNTIKNLREKKGLTQLQLANIINVSDKTVSRWETGKGFPDISLVQTLAEALGISVIELFSGQTVTNHNVSANMLRAGFYISFIAYVTSDRVNMVKLYPEGNAQTRFFIRGDGYIYYYCNHHGLMRQKISRK